MRSGTRCVGWVVAFLAVSAISRADLVRNGGFEQSADGKPTEWVVEGDEGVKQTLSMGEGVTGGRSARLTCDAFERRTRDSYATLAQTGLPGVQAFAVTGPGRGFLGLQFAGRSKILAPAPGSGGEGPGFRVLASALSHDREEIVCATLDLP